MFYELDKIKQMRQKLGLTQTQLAKLAGVSQSMITKIERGTIEPSYLIAKKIISDFEYKFFTPLFFVIDKIIIIYLKSKIFFQQSNIKNRLGKLHNSTIFLLRISVTEFAILAKTGRYDN